jgi:hydroxymethylpyrimidine/phosphomethylpyrimidine kinase
VYGEKTVRREDECSAGPDSADAAHADLELDEENEAHELIRKVLALGPQTVVLTGGHRYQAVDLFLDSVAPDRPVRIPGERHPDGASHGSGCTHSSVLAAQLALGHTPLQAACVARTLTGSAVARGLRDIGGGPGPVDAIGLAALRHPQIP